MKLGRLRRSLTVLDQMARERADAVD